MLRALAASSLAHGANGSWLDEFVELGLPLIVFVILYLWSGRKKKPPTPGGDRSEPK